MDKFSSKVKSFAKKVAGVSEYDSKKASVGSLADMHRRKQASKSVAKGPFRSQ